MRTEKPQLAKRKGTIHAHALGILHLPVRFVAKIFHRHYHRKYHRAYRHAKKLFVLDMVLLGIIAALVLVGAYFLFFPPSLARKVSLTAETKTEITSGGLVTYTISFENKSRKIITSSTLAVRLPPHFRYLRSFPREFDPERHIINLGTLNPKDKGQVKITGILWAEVDAPSTLFSTLSFVDDETNTRDVKVLRQDFPVTHSVLMLEPQLPARIVGNQEMTFSLKYINTSDEILNRVRVRPIWPKGFRFLSSEPALTWGVWELGNLTEGAEDRIIITGITPDYTNGINFGFASSIEIDGQELGQGTIETMPALVESPLKLEVSLETKNPSIVLPGETVQAHLNWQNESELVLEDVVLGLQVKSPFVEAVEEVSEAGRLEPGASGSADFSFTLRDRVVASQLAEDDSGKEFSLVVLPIATAREESLGSFQARGAEAVRRIRTPAVLETKALYWTPQGDQIGRGPIPPAVNETTKYWIFWTLEPTTNDLENLEARTALPGTVEFTQRQSLTAGRLSFDPATRVVRWSVEALPATLLAGNAVARFEVAITPTLAQVGTFPSLMNEIYLSAYDVFADMELETTADGLTTARAVEE